MGEREAASPFTRTARSERRTELEEAKDLHQNKLIDTPEAKALRQSALARCAQALALLCA